LQVLLLAGGVLEEKTTTKRRMGDAHWRLYCSRRSNLFRKKTRSWWVQGQILGMEKRWASMSEHERASEKTRKRTSSKRKRGQRQLMMLARYHGRRGGESRRTALPGGGPSLDEAVAGGRQCAHCTTLNTLQTANRRQKRKPKKKKKKTRE
jgi:hypothetical protein